MAGTNAPVRSDADTLGDDLLKGMDQIAGFIGASKRRAFYLAEKGLIPCGKLGANWIASKRALREHYARLTNGRP
jgi:hypothetical protein